jgi:pantoate--beta-alanine ligase
MEIIRKIDELQNRTTALKHDKQTIGFVATMGFLHEGHTALMKASREENDVLVVSIFVNPLQFGPTEDFDEYPRNEEQDIQIAEKAGADLLFLPEVSEMYPDVSMIEMKITERVDVLCGSSRPGHFDGVITVLTKLFHIVQPDHSYFGLKDAQQVAVVDALLNNLNFPTKIIGVPTVRESDGLAKSSRNVRLSTEEREEAKGIYQALLKGQKLLVEGENNPAVIIKEVKAALEKSTTKEIDYVDLLSFPDLKEMNSINDQIIIAVAVKFQDARLIDNLIMDANGKVITQFN